MVGAGFLGEDHVFAGITGGLDQGDAAAAERAVRRMLNRHGCQAAALLAEAVERGWQNKAARIRQNPAAYCNHPRHGEDALLLGEALQWLGLRPTPAPVRRRDAVTARPKQRERRGRCRGCGKRQAIRVDGTVRGHGGCPGEGLAPKEDE